MDLARRFALCFSSAGIAISADMVTKAVPHDTVAHNGAHTPILIVVLVSCFLWGLALCHSRLLAIGAGLMFGGLCGNVGQLVLNGYATDWIPVGGWLTNVADISGALGLVCCFAGYIVTAQRRRTVRSRILEA